jgi:hypothetical protein
MTWRRKNYFSEMKMKTDKPHAVTVVLINPPLDPTMLTLAAIAVTCYLSDDTRWI